ncbi:hypothetical protein ACFY3N_13275 [Streptomyces sp. NPDC000348]|uniref:hypothetical protein n=1 Tax=Streptomyces sp. NPDC000348 TaxID=3364538 RepID=UPI003688749E
MPCANASGAPVHAVVEDLGRSPAYAGVLYAVQGAGSAADAALVGLVGHRLLPAVPGCALGAVTAAALSQSPASAERTASRSPSDASPA